MFVEKLRAEAGPKLEYLVAEAVKLPFEAKAQATAQMYRRANDKRAEWTESHGLPKNESTLILYLLQRAREIGSSALAGISAAYQTANSGLSVMAASFISDLMKTKRREEIASRKEFVEVTINDIDAITRLALENNDAMLDRDACLAILSFHAMLRVSEAAQLKWSGVIQKGEMFEVRIEKAKNDQMALGRSSFFEYKAGSDADVLLCRWRLRTKNFTSPYVFTNLKGNDKLSAASLSACASNMLGKIGKKGATHHCFRRGGANYMQQQGFGLEEIRTRGRWRSMTGMMRYLRDSPEAQGCKGERIVESRSHEAEAE